jgi:hypothetical protein
MEADFVLPKDRPDRESKTITYIDPLLLCQRIIVADDTLYLLYPLPLTFCSQHANKIPLKERAVSEIMEHLCSTPHLDRVQLLPNGVEARRVGDVVSICEYCLTIPGNIRDHMMEHHKVGLFNTTLKCTTCESVDISFIEKTSYLSEADVLSVDKP